MTDAATPSAAGSRWRSRHAAVAAALALVVTAGIGFGEWRGWPWLAPQVQRWLSDTLDRDVRVAGSGDAQAADATAFRVRFIGGIRLHAPALEIAAPAWSSAPNMVLARDVAVELRYIDLWRAHRGQPLRVHRLQAARLDGTLERLADGRASWQFGAAPAPDQATETASALPSVGSLQVAAGAVRYRDEVLAVDLEATLSLADRAVAPDAVGGAGLAAGQLASLLQIAANGRYRGLPLTATLASSGVMPWSAEATSAAPFPVTLQVTVGRASLDFVGSAADVSSLHGLSGRFNLKGPSLAAVGDPLGVTLPTTAAFRSAGAIVKQGDTWRVVVEEATVGASRLNGAFTYEAGRSVPLLSGRLRGSRLLLADLGPAIGTTPAVTASAVTVGANAVPEPALLPARTRGAGKVLPNRPFDLAALRTMDANVLIDIVEVDLDTRLLEPLRPLHTHLQLNGGVLTLGELHARTGEGRVRGTLRLDGREAAALWHADLRWDGIRLERWIRQGTAAGTPDYVSGSLSGRAVLEGKGRSTAEILASMKGQTRSRLRDGSISHLAIEALGLDVAEGLGVLASGDDALTVQCAVADAAVERGVFRPRLMVLDTKDSVVWVEGSVSLASEALDLRAVVTPKDFSPLALRTPLRLQGSLADPVVLLEAEPLSLKVAAAIALAFIHPLAALVPLIDPGDAEAASNVSAGCRSLVQRGAARLAAVSGATVPATRTGKR